MKKLLIISVIVLGLGMNAFPQGGLFQYGAVRNEDYYSSSNSGESQRDGLLQLGLPSHGQADNQTAPIGEGVAIFIGLGAAYLMGKKRYKK